MWKFARGVAEGTVSIQLIPLFGWRRFCLHSSLDGFLAFQCTNLSENKNIQWVTGMRGRSLSLSGEENHYRFCLWKVFGRLPTKMTPIDT